MRFIYNDGIHGPDARVAGQYARRKDCVARAIAIAAELPYHEVASAIDRMADEEFFDGSDSKHGVCKPLQREYLRRLGWAWVPTMRVGSGCKVHLRDGDLPMGRLIVSVSRHIVAVIDGVIHDIHDPSRGGARCVYGYHVKENTP